jgi:uncharacterized protein (DUF1778 family)
VDLDGKEATVVSEAKSARINLRLNPEGLETIRLAASVQQQDLTSFVLGAAMERARVVIAEDRLLTLTPHEVNQLERALDAEPEVNAQLKAFIQRLDVNREAATS